MVKMSNWVGVILWGGGVYPIYKRWGVTFWHNSCVKQYEIVCLWIFEFVGSNMSGNSVISVYISDEFAR